MTTSLSKSSSNRKIGKHQVDEQRASILDAAEKLFLQNGLENTRMVDIANQAGITRVTLYRYFANRDAIAVEIQVRMMNRISDMIDVPDQDFSLAGHKRRAQAMIRNFAVLRDAYRYIGMFDQVYLDRAPGDALAQWTKNQLSAQDWGGDAPGERERLSPQGNQLGVIMNTIIWFLEKLALRGELTWSDKSVPLEEHLKVFEEMMMLYFDQLMQK